MAESASTSALGQSKSSSSCTCTIILAENPSRTRRVCTRVMAILMMSAAVPCIGWFMAVRSAACATFLFGLNTSGTWRLRPYIVSTQPFSCAKATSESR